MDTDAVFVKPIDPKLLGYDVVLSHDIYFSHQRPFPDFAQLRSNDSKEEYQILEIAIAVHEALHRFRMRI